MGFIIEMIIKLIFVYLLSFPGALIRWGFNGFKDGEYEKYFKKSIYQNYLILMVLVGIIVAIIQFAPFAFGQEERSCRQQIENGKFIYLDSIEGNTFIERSGGFQIEKEEKLGFKVKLKVKWLTDCKYTLQLVEIMENPNQLPFPPNAKDIISTVEVLTITKESYKVVMSSNVNEKKIEGTILIR